MTVVIGPVLKRADGYEFDTWTAGKEVARGYPYRRIEDAYYARNADIKASAQGRAPAAIVCQTLDEFIVKLTEDGYPINDAISLPRLRDCNASCTIRSGSAIGRSLSAGGLLQGKSCRPGSQISCSMTPGRSDYREITS